MGLSHFWQRLSSSQKVSLVSLIIFLLALPVGLYLSQRPQIFNPRAATPITPPVATSTPSLTSFPTPTPAPARGTTKVNVLVLKYFPLDSTGTRLDKDLTDSDMGLEVVRAKVNNITQQGLEKLTDATRYHGYKDPDAQPYLGYSILEEHEFLKPIPEYLHSNIPDYRKILTTDVDICDYVDQQGVRQVWMWGYHTASVEPNESNMSMGTKSRAFWNYPNYGDVSNTSKIDDMPTCQNTYVLYNYNFIRGLGELLEDHGHQIESLFKYIDLDMWEYKFVQRYGEPYPTINRCGWTHSPPNTKGGYDWSNETNALSDCEDWKPNGGGEIKTVNCHTWYGSDCKDNGGIEFKVWWMQNIPGINNGLTCGDGTILRNWWEFYGDLDQALLGGKSLSTGACNNTVEQNIYLRSGYNIVGLATHRGGIYQASDFLNDLNRDHQVAESIHRYRPDDREWDTYSIEGEDNVDFPIVSGRAYFVRATTAGLVTIRAAQRLLSYHQITVKSGWSLISLYIDTGNLRARELLKIVNDQGINAPFLARWNGENYEANERSAKNNFEIVVGEGYWIYNDGETKNFNLENLGIPIYRDPGPF
ncbi:hypothetical protein CMO96_01880 [Candidatus Woesebacteria bacterium]|nr:hypothetical protein [Candidatus Woesebacteria bacterium]